MRRRGREEGFARGDPVLQGLRATQLLGQAQPVVRGQLAKHHGGLSIQLDTDLNSF